MRIQGRLIHNRVKLAPWSPAHKTLMLCVRAPARGVSVPGHTWPHTMLSRPLGTAPAFPHPTVLPCNSQCSHVRMGVGCSKLTGDSNDKVTKSSMWTLECYQGAGGMFWGVSLLLCAEVVPWDRCDGCHQVTLWRLQSSLPPFPSAWGRLQGAQKVYWANKISSTQV